MHFFKIFHSSIIQDKRLELPKEFSRKFGNELSDHAVIKVPNGIWHVGMTKAEGLVLFENGWPEFMEFYSICVGHLMVFRYDGNSMFQVHIFGMNATEIKYPSHFENADHDVEVISNHSDDVEVISVHPPEVEIILVHSDNSDNSNQTKDEPSISTLGMFASSEGRHNQRAEPIRHEFPQASQQQKPTSKFAPKRSYTAAFQASRLQESELEAAKEVTYDNPSYKVLMRPSYVKGGYVRVPTVFAKRYLKSTTQMEVTLRVSDGRIWEVKYLARVQYGQRLSQGWSKFVSDNHLKEGDLCVFELVGRINVEMNVHIFQVSQEIVSLHSGSATQTKKEPPMSTLVEFASSEGRVNQEAEPATHEFSQASRNQKASSKFTPKRSYTVAFQASRFQESALEAAKEFKSANPFYKILLQSSYLKAGYVRVPMVFATSYLKNKTGTGVILRVSDGRTWEVQYLSRTHGNRGFYQGWAKFVSDNHLKEGDICVFELVDRIHVQMNVHIFQDVEVVSVHPAEVEIISVHSGNTQSNDEPSMSTLGVFSSNEDRQNQIAESAWREFPQTDQQQRVFASKFTPKRSYTTAFQARQLQEST
ncbi:hypothetical protein MKX01_029592 [Papaver californicum]|nr:hypothetical protein MKX01_029592 [Papaver californicum]